MYNEIRVSKGQHTQRGKDIFCGIFLSTPWSTSCRLYYAIHAIDLTEKLVEFLFPLHRLSSMDQLNSGNCSLLVKCELWKYCFEKNWFWSLMHNEEWWLFAAINVKDIVLIRCTINDNCPADPHYCIFSSCQLVAIMIANFARSISVLFLKRWIWYHPRKKIYVTRQLSQNINVFGTTKIGIDTSSW